MQVTKLEVQGSGRRERLGCNMLAPSAESLGQEQQQPSRTHLRPLNQRPSNAPPLSRNPAAFTSIISPKAKYCSLCPVTSVLDPCTKKQASECPFLRDNDIPPKHNEYYVHAIADALSRTPDRPLALE